MNGRWLFVLLVGSHGLMAAEPGRIEVFTTARTPIARASTPAVRVYHLDLPTRIEAELSASLPQDREAATQLASAALQGTWRKSAETLTHAYRGLLKARRYGLQKLPAMVFDGQAVVYGVIDPEQALGDYRHWRDSKR
ncbi:MAG: TIGR03757 family integrating conjugative element protein [Gammaproteobacteria bacterium]